LGTFWTEGQLALSRPMVVGHEFVGKIVEVGSNVSQVISEKVKSVTPDGVATLECTWEAVKMHMSLPMGGDMDFDSTQAGGASSAPGPGWPGAHPG
jgi:threonine dehydrogenase-like Zn-dependent dehydrogenase